MDSEDKRTAPQKAQKLLPALEMEVMKVLWNLGEGTVGKVQKELYNDRPLAYTTVMTMLDRLTRKGVVTREKQGRSYRYTPVMHKGDALQLALDRLLHDFFGDSSRRLVEHLANEQGPRTPVESHEPALDSSLL